MLFALICMLRNSLGRGLKWDRAGAAKISVSVGHLHTLKHTDVCYFWMFLEFFNITVSEVLNAKVDTICLFA